MTDNVIGGDVPRLYGFLRMTIFFLFFVALGRPVMGASTLHFIDEQGNGIAKFEPIWNTLSNFYGDSMPARIKLTKKEFGDGTSRFNCENDTIFINPAAFQNNPVEEIGHESSHLALCHLTGRANLDTSSRFWDEGFANIEGSLAAGRSEKYKKLALIIAADQFRKGNVSFSKVKDWDQYWGLGKNSSAYQVGSSFDYFLIDAFSSGKLREFFASMGKTHDLNLSLHTVFGLSQRQVEAAWGKYLAAVDLSTLQPPKIIRMSPANGSEAVSTSLSEIWVQFSADMSPGLFLATRCNDGICYKNAYWKDSRTLVIRVDPVLLSKHRYSIRLGYSNEYPLRSVLNVPLPLTVWHFTTQ